MSEEGSQGGELPQEVMDYWNGRDDYVIDNKEAMLGAYTADKKGVLEPSEDDEKLLLMSGAIKKVTEEPEGDSATEAEPQPGDNYQVGEASGDGNADLDDVLGGDEPEPAADAAASEGEQAGEPKPTLEEELEKSGKEAVSPDEKPYSGPDDTPKPAEGEGAGEGYDASGSKAEAKPAEPAEPAGDEPAQPYEGADGSGAKPAEDEAGDDDVTEGAPADAAKAIDDILAGEDDEDESVEDKAGHKPGEKDSGYEGTTPGEGKKTEGDKPKEEAKPAVDLDALAPFYPQMRYMLNAKTGATPSDEQLAKFLIDGTLRVNGKDNNGLYFTTDGGDNYTELGVLQPVSEGLGSRLRSASGYAVGASGSRHRKAVYGVLAVAGLAAITLGVIKYTGNGGLEGSVASTADGDKDDGKEQAPTGGQQPTATQPTKPAQPTGQQPTATQPTKPAQPTGQQPTGQQSVYKGINIIYELRGGGGQEHVYTVKEGTAQYTALEQALGGLNVPAQGRVSQMHSRVKRRLRNFLASNAGVKKYDIVPELELERVVRAAGAKPKGTQYRKP